MRFALTRSVLVPGMAIAALVCMTEGCTFHKGAGVETEVQDLQNRIYELQKRNAEAQVEIQELREQETGQAGAATTGPTLPAPSGDAGGPQGTIADPAVPGSTVDLGEEGPTRNEDAPAVTSPASQTAGSTSQDSTGGASPEPDKLFVDAYAQFNGGNYQRAQDEFGEFLSLSPESDLADDAQYWIGECLFSRKDYRRAILEFRKVIDQYPFGNRVPHAFLKVGLSYLALGDRDRATESLETVVQAFPKSEVATVAQATLDELKKPAKR